MGGDRAGGVEIDNRILNFEFFYVNVQFVFVCSCICFCYAEVWVGTTEEELKLINSCGRHKTFLGLTPTPPFGLLRSAYLRLILTFCA